MHPSTLGFLYGYTDKTAADSFLSAGDSGPRNVSPLPKRGTVSPRGTIRGAVDSLPFRGQGDTPTYSERTNLVNNIYGNAPNTGYADITVAEDNAFKKNMAKKKADMEARRKATLNNLPTADTAKDYRGEAETAFKEKGRNAKSEFSRIDKEIAKEVEAEDLAAGRKPTSNTSPEGIANFMAKYPNVKLPPDIVAKASGGKRTETATIWNESPPPPYPQPEVKKPEVKKPGTTWNGRAETALNEADALSIKPKARKPPKQSVATTPSAQPTAPEVGEQNYRLPQRPRPKPQVAQSAQPTAPAPATAASSMRSPQGADPRFKAWKDQVNAGTAKLTSDQQQAQDYLAQMDAAIAQKRQARQQAQLAQMQNRRKSYRV